MSNLASAASQYCCGMVEIGNFAYTKDQGPRGAPHYHRGKSGGWNPQHSAPGTTEKEIRDLVKHLITFHGAVVCTTGADQEYLDDILPRIGFMRQDFDNRTHERGLVKFWFLAAANYREGCVECEEGHKLKEKP